MTEAVSFRTRLQKGNRVQVPKPIRVRFKLETSQVLEVTVCPVNMRMNWETFYGKMDKSGRITIPKLNAQPTADESTPAEPNGHGC